MNLEKLKGERCCSKNVLGMKFELGYTLGFAINESFGWCQLLKYNENTKDWEEWSNYINLGDLKGLPDTIGKIINKKEG